MRQRVRAVAGAMRQHYQLFTTNYQLFPTNYQLLRFPPVHSKPVFADVLDYFGAQAIVHILTFEGHEEPAFFFDFVFQVLDAANVVFRVVGVADVQQGQPAEKGEEAEVVQDEGGDVEGRSTAAFSCHFNHTFWILDSRQVILDS